MEKIKLILNKEVRAWKVMLLGFLFVVCGTAIMVLTSNEKFFGSGMITFIAGVFLIVLPVVLFYSTQSKPNTE